MTSRVCSIRQMPDFPARTPSEVRDSLQKTKIKELVLRQTIRSHRVSDRREGKEKCGQGKETAKCFLKPISTLPPF